MATVDGVRQTVLLKDFLDYGIQPGLFLRTRGAIRWELTAIPCPYCRRVLARVHPRSPSQPVGRILIVEGPANAESQTVIVDPWPAGLCYLTCRSCKKAEFTMTTRHMTAARRELGGQ